MNRTVKHSLPFLIRFGALLSSGPVLAQCVKPADTAECSPLKGMNWVGFRIDIPKYGGPFGITKTALRDSTLLTITRLIPEIQVEESPGRSPQIHVQVSYLGENPNAGPLHFQVALRTITTRRGRVVWDTTWLTNYIISASAAHPANAIMTSLKESLRRFAADWHRANPNLSSKKTNGPQG